MFGCYYNDSSKSIQKEEFEVFDSVLTEGQALIKNLSFLRENVRLKFLILLPNEDYKKCIFSYKDIIMYRKKHFPGDLIIEKYAQCHNLPYIIQDPPMPRQLYIMLPKEKLFVASEIFTGCYIRSKMRELIQIFVKLNAKCVKFKHYDSQKESKSICMDVGTNMPNAKLSQGINLRNEHDKITTIQYEMKFDANTNPFTTNHFLSDTYYYLKHEPSWQDIIVRRLDYKMTYDKYTFKNTERQLLKHKFITNMKALNLSLDYDWEKFQDFCIEYEIEYYPDITRATEEVEYGETEENKI